MLGQRQSRTYTHIGVRDAGPRCSASAPLQEVCTPAALVPRQVPPLNIATESDVISSYVRQSVAALLSSGVAIVMCHDSASTPLRDVRGRRRGQRDCDREGLGDVIPGDVGHFGYGVDYFGIDGNGGKRFGVRFHEKPSAHVFEWASATQANYEPDSVTLEEDRLVVVYRDAELGLPEIGAIRAFSHLNGIDVQPELPVTLLR